MSRRMRSPRGAIVDVPADAVIVADRYVFPTGTDLQRDVLVPAATANGRPVLPIGEIVR